MSAYRRRYVWRTPDPGIHLFGEPIVVSYLAEPVISRGRFRLENHGDSTARTSVESAWVRIDRRRQSLRQVFLFDVETDQELDPNRLEVAPGKVGSSCLGLAGC